MNTKEYTIINSSNKTKGRRITHADTIQRRGSTEVPTQLNIKSKDLQEFYGIHDNTTEEISS